MYNVKAKMGTMVTLELEADGKIVFVSNLGKGSIDIAEIREFEAISGDGKLFAIITNTGQLTSSYTTQMNCSREVLDIIAQPIFLKPMESYQVNQEVQVKSEVGQNHTCELILYDNIGTVLDTYLINFTTTDLIHHSSD